MGEDLLEDSWFVREWLKKGEEKGVVQTARKLLLTMIQAHFPEHMPLAKDLVKGAKDPEILEALAIKVIKAQDQQGVAQLLVELASQTKQAKS